MDDRLARAITGDRDPRVRAAAIFAAGFREGDALVEALIRTATGDAVEYVRGDAVSALRRQPATSSPVHEALAQAAAHDPKLGIRRLAREALSERSPGMALLGAPAPPTARPLPASPARRR
ncbi:MAG TPA: HEAT repeat domain-containing protein [Myxococcaceae bacterium]|nr:HEAT repeat domain-containing protein [Myxococcaceae bacterium]